jgi:carbamoyltransferase
VIIFVFLNVSSNFLYFFIYKLVDFKQLSLYIILRFFNGFIGDVMYILGIDAYGHDTAATLLHDGNLVALAEEERFTRVKHAPHAFPNKAIDFCLKRAGIKLTDVDHVAYFTNQNIFINKFWKFHPYFERLILTRPHEFFGMLYQFKRRDNTVKELAKKAGAKLHFVEHHMAHAASAFYGSGFKKAGILSIDGRGELKTTFMGMGDGVDIESVGHIDLPHSVGLMYSGMTELLGFTANNCEGKIMGLAAYGKDRYKKQFDKVIWKTKDGFKTDPRYYWGHVYGLGEGYEKKYYTKAALDLFGITKIRGRDQSPIDGKHEHIAYSLQAKTEEIGLHLAKLVYEKTGQKNLCLAGGVCLNSKMNGEIFKQDFVDDIYIIPPANDVGTSLGAAMHVYTNITGKRPGPVEHVYLGTEYSNEEIKKYLEKCKVKFHYEDDVAGYGAELVNDGKIIGWFQGRMEVGPRALGSRSILSHPGIKGMKDQVNHFVKNREGWRPFALSLTYEAKDKYLDHGFHSPFMILIDTVPKEVQEEVIEGVHVDGTTRPQTVEKRINPLYYDLIHKFGKLSGTPVVMNTSFNLAGEPIVENPSQALMDFYGSGMDKLIMGNYVIEK